MFNKNIKVGVVIDKAWPIFILNKNTKELYSYIINVPEETLKQWKKAIEEYKNVQTQIANYVGEQNRVSFKAIDDDDDRFDND